MRTIHKIVLEPIDVQTIQIPKDAIILTAREQHEAPCIWYMCNPERGKQLKQIYMFGTGHEISAGHYEYIGTCHLMSGSLILHVFQ